MTSITSTPFTPSASTRSNGLSDGRLGGGSVVIAGGSDTKLAYNHDGAAREGRSTRRRTLIPLEKTSGGPFGSRTRNALSGRGF